MFSGVKSLPTCVEAKSIIAPDSNACSCADARSRTIQKVERVVIRRESGGERTEESGLICYSGAVEVLTLRNLDGSSNDDKKLDPDQPSEDGKRIYIYIPGEVIEGSQNVTKLALFGSRHESEKIARNRQRPVVNRRPLDRELKDDSIVRSHQAQDIKQKTMSNPQSNCHCVRGTG